MKISCSNLIFAIKIIVFLREILLTRKDLVLRNIYLKKSPLWKKTFPYLKINRLEPTVFQIASRRVNEFRYRFYWIENQYLIDHNDSVKTRFSLGKYPTTRFVIIKRKRKKKQEKTGWEVTLKKLRIEEITIWPALNESN